MADVITAVTCRVQLCTYSVALSCTCGGASSRQRCNVYTIEPPLVALHSLDHLVVGVTEGPL